VPGVAGQHFEMARQKLDDLVRRADEANRLARRGNLIAVHRHRNLDRALATGPILRRDGRWRKARLHSGFDGLHRRPRHVSWRRHGGFPRDPPVHREDEWDGGIGRALAGAPPHDGHRGHDGHCKHQDDEKDHDGDGMRVASFTTLAASTRKARGVPRIASGYTGTPPRVLCPRCGVAQSSSLVDWLSFARFVRPLACENPAAAPRPGRLRLASPGR